MVKRRVIRKHLLAAAAGTALALMSATSSFAFDARLDLFTVTKNGSPLLSDGFSDGAPPPSGASEIETYRFIQGTLSESGGRVTIGAATGGVAANADGTLTKTAGATFASDIGANGTLGLRSNNTFLVSGVFDILTTPAIGDGYGIRLTDRGADGAQGGDVLELGILRRENGSVGIVYRRQDFLSGLITNYSVQSVAGGDQIEFMLGKPNADPNSGIQASFRYVVGGTPGTPTLLRTTELNGVDPIRLFGGETYTRAEFFAVTAVPEPETYAMLIAGIGLIGWQLRRKSRKTSAKRFY